LGVGYFSLEVMSTRLTSGTMAEGREHGAESKQTREEEWDTDQHGSTQISQTSPKDLKREWDAGFAERSSQISTDSL
jgi:hypothetical protein